MADVTYITRSPMVAPARLQLQGMLMQELSIPKRTYGGLADTLRAAKLNGYAVKQVLTEGDVLPTTEAIMNDLLPFKPYLGNADAAWVAPFSAIDASNNAGKMFSIVPGVAEMVAGSSGGGVIVPIGGKPALDLSIGQGRGMAAPLNPDDFNVYANGRTLQWQGIISAIPTSGTGQIFRVISGNVTYMSFGVVPGGEQYRVIANRRIGSGGSLQQVTVDGGTVALGTTLQVVVFFDVIAGLITIQVNGVKIIDSYAWGAGTGILDAAGVTAQIAVPGAGNTQNVQHRAAALVNTADTAVNAGVRSALASATS